jgi:pimeloyl-ACP methyl ester carboxylesterase
MMTSRIETQWLDRPGGRIAYDVQGEGPLVVCLPGMGDLRQSYRFLAPRLAAAGYRVATMDLRGLGESSAAWDDYGQRAMGEDALALVERLGGPAVIVGHSFTPESAIHAAVKAPDQVVGTVLLGPWARRPPMKPWMEFLVRRVVRSPRLWSLFYRSLYPGEKPEDFSAYLRALRRSLGEPGRRDAFTRIASAEAVDALDARGRLARPALIVMGDRDPDFRDPAAEAEAMRAALPNARARVVMIPDCGHYPHAQRPEETAAAILPFLREIGHGG